MDLVTLMDRVQEDLEDQFASKSSIENLGKLEARGGNTVEQLLLQVQGEVEELHYNRRSLLMGELTPRVESINQPKIHLQTTGSCRILSHG